MHEDTLNTGLSADWKESLPKLASRTDRKKIAAWMQDVLCTVGYAALPRLDKGIVRTFLQEQSGASRTTVMRVIGSYTMTLRATPVIAPTPVVVSSASEPARRFITPPHAAHVTGRVVVPAALAMAVLMIVTSQLKATTGLRASVLDTRSRLEQVEAMADRINPEPVAVAMTPSGDLVPRSVLVQQMYSQNTVVQDMLMRRADRLEARLNQLIGTTRRSAPSAITGILHATTVASLTDLLGKGKEGQILTVVGGKVRWADAPFLRSGGYGIGDTGTGGRNPNQRGGGGSSPANSSNSTTTIVQTGSSDLGSATGTLGTNHGGTGFASFALGDLLVGAADGTLSKLAVGPVGYVLTSTGGTVQWLTATGGTGGSANTGSIIAIGDARYVNIAGDTMTGALVIQNGTVHTPTATALLNVRGTMSGTSLVLSDLRNCNTIDTDSNGVLMCGMDATAMSGLSQTDGDARYVRKAGDTMTGVLVIQNGTVHSATATALLNVRGTMSGRSLYVSGTGATPLFVTNSATGNVGIGTRTPAAALEVVGTLSGSRLAIGGSVSSVPGIESYILGNLGIATKIAKANLDVHGTISGNFINLNGGHASQPAIMVHYTGAAPGDFMRFVDLGGTTLFAFGSNGNASIGKSTANAKLDVVGTISGSALTVTALKNCALIITDINGNTSCGTVPINSATMESRYVNVSGDTMTGALAIQNGTNHSATTTPLLNVRGTMSGRSLVITGTGSSPLVFTNITTGHVGIGTTNPKAKLDVQGTMSGSGLMINGTGSFMIGSNTFSVNQTAFIVHGATNNVGIGTAAPKTKLEVTGTISGALVRQNGAGNNYFLGNVGIGTTSPVTALAVTTNNKTALVVTGSGTTVTSGMATFNDSIRGVGVMIGGFDDETNGGYIATTSSHPLLFGTAVGINGPAQMMLNTDGNVGIGTKSTTARFAVQGTISGAALTVTGLKSCAFIITNGNGVTSCGSASTFAYTAGQGLSVSSNVFRLNSTITGSLVRFTTVSGSLVYARNTLSSSGTLSVLGATVLQSTLNVTGNSTFDTNTLFVEASANNVGIGTTSPKAKLDVLGTISGSVLVINGGVTQNTPSVNAFRGNIGIGLNATTTNALTVFSSTAAQGLFYGFSSVPTVGYTGNQVSDGEIRLGSEATGFTRLSHISANGDPTLANLYIDNTAAGNMYIRTNMNSGGTFTGAVLDGTNKRFGINKSVPKATLDVTGTMSGSLLTIHGGATGLSYILGNVSIGKMTSAAKLDVAGTISGSALTVTGLKSCALIMTDVNGNTSCGTASLSLATADSRFVNTAGDTMTGALAIQNGTVHSATATPLLNVRGTISGATLFGTNTVATSGAVIIRSHSSNGVAIYGNTSGANFFDINTGNFTMVTKASSTTLTLGTVNTPRLIIDANGHTHPGSSNGYDLGLTTARWRTLYLSGAGLMIGSSSTNTSAIDYRQQSGTWGLGLYGSTSTSTPHMFLSSGGLLGVGSLSPKAKLDVGGTLSGAGLVINGTSTMYGNIVPGLDNKYDLGTTSTRWRSMYLSGGSLHIGSSTHDAVIGANVSGTEGLAFYGKASNTRPDIFVSSGGRIGIGTGIGVSGSHKFSVSGASLISQGALTVSNQCSGIAGCGTTANFSVLNGSNGLGATFYSLSADRTVNILDDAGANYFSSDNFSVSYAGFLTMSGSGSFSSGLTVDTDTLFVDATPNNVGIGTLTPKSKLDVLGTVSGSSLTVTNLKSCALVITNVNGTMSCGTASLSLTTADGRYVNAAGDTMTGALAIQNGTNHTATTTPLLNVRGTMSGRSLYITGTGASPLLFTSITTGRVGIGTSAPKATLDVLGTISGAFLVVSNSSTFSNSNITFSASGNTVFNTNATNVSFSIAGKKNPNLFYVNAAGSGGVIGNAMGSGSGGIGIGTRSPITQLHVAGRVPMGKVGTVTTGLSNPIATHVQGRYAYVASYGNSSLVIFDVSNPAAPVQVGSTTSGITNPWYVTVQGRYAYVASYGNSSLVIFDVSNPAAPVQVGSTTSGLSQPRTVLVQGGYAYVTDVGNSSLIVFNVSNPALPVRVSSTTGFTSTLGMAVQGRYAYVTATQSFIVVDISNPAKPVKISTASSNGNSPTDITVRGRYVYMVSASNGRLGIYDVSNPASPTSVGFTTSGMSNPYGLVVQGRYAYVANNLGANITVYDISNPASITSVGSISGMSLPYRFTIQGRYMYFPDSGNNALSMFDLGGAYIESLEVGGLEAATLSLNGNLSAVDASLRGGLSVLGGFQVQKASSITSTSSGAFALQIISAPTRAVNSSGALAISVYGQSRSPHITFGSGTTFDTNLYRSAASTLRTDGTFIVGSTISGAGLVINGTVGSHLVPSADNTWNLGSNTNRWRDMYLSGGSLHIGSSSVEGKIGYKSSGFEGLQFFGSGGALSPQMFMSSGGLLGIGSGNSLVAKTTIFTDNNFNQSAMLIKSKENGIIPLFKLTTDFNSVNNTVFDLYSNGSIVMDGDIRSNGFYVENPGADSYFNDRLLVGSSSYQTPAQMEIFTPNAFGSPALVIDSNETGEQDLFVIRSEVAAIDDPVFRVTTGGATFADDAYSGAGADYAEWFYSADYVTLHPGDLVCIDTTRTNAVRKCMNQSDPNLMGIISTNPAYIGNSVTSKTVDLNGLPIPGYVLVGLIGQVPAKVLVESGATIHPGDSLTSSATPGYARKALPGETTVGVALEGLNSGNGVINVLISRTNKSLTVDMLDQKVRDNIAELEIGDQITQSLQDGLAALNLSDEVRDAVAALTTDPMDAMTAEIAKLKMAVHTLTGALANMSGALTQRSAVSGQPLGQSLTMTGTIAAGDLISEGTLTVSSDTRIGGDLYLEGSLRADSLFLPNGMRIDGGLEVGGALSTDQLHVESGATIKGGLKVEGTLELGSGSLVLGSGSTLNIQDIMVRGAMQVVGNITIEGLATFLGDVSIEGELTLSSNQTGFIDIPMGATGATITFTTPMKNMPVVQATPQGRVGSEWWIDASSQMGFTIRTAMPVLNTVRFSWTAITTAQTSTGVMMPMSSSNILFPTDSNGVPVSTNAVWNNCIRNIPTMDESGQPFNCSRYHNANQWDHPDLNISFIWNDNITPAFLQVPNGYIPTVIQAASSSSSISSESSSSVSSESSSASSESSVSSSSSSQESSSVSSEASSSSESSEASSSSESSIEVQTILPPL